MEVQREYIRQKEGSSTEINQIIGRPPGRDIDVHTLQTGRRNLKLALNSSHKTFCCVLFTVADEKGWKLVQLSIWESEQFENTCS